MFSWRGFQATKCKTHLTTAPIRIEKLKNKRLDKINKMTNSLTGQEVGDKSLKKSIAREKDIIVAYDIMGDFCVSIAGTLSRIESQKVCPKDIKEEVTTLIYASSKCADLPELVELTALFRSKYGSGFVNAALKLSPECGVNGKIIEVFSDGEETNLSPFQQLRTRFTTKAKTKFKNSQKLWSQNRMQDRMETSANGERKLEWKVVQTGPLHYFGRRLECQNKRNTFPEFLPSLANYIREQGWAENDCFAVDSNVIHFTHSGNEVIVEYCDTHLFVDVLVSSSQPLALAMQFVDKHVVMQIELLCASPKAGRQGVPLVEAVVRKVCIEKLYLSKDRKVHSVLISTLMEGISINICHKHTWSKRIPCEEDNEFALDLLDGEGAYNKLTNFASSSSHASPAALLTTRDQSPKLFYPSIENVSKLRRLNNCLRFGAKKMPIKLHLMCDHKDGHHKVTNQPGRIIQLSWREGKYGVPIMKFAVTLLWAGVVVASSISGGTAPGQQQVENWMQKLFDVPEIPDIDVITLHQMMNFGRTSEPVSELDILTALEQYWKIDPDTQGLKMILNLQDVAQFWKDFRLKRVVYTAAQNNETKIGWVCEDHFWPGLHKRILRSA